MRCAVAFIVFNRPQLTAQVFAHIREQRPPRLFIIADGARAERTSEHEKVAACRAITDAVDWDCIVARNYSDTNLGCRRRVSSGLDWVFFHAPEAIVLEDDCLPAAAFFAFCEELLERYRTNPKVAVICGSCYHPDAVLAESYRGSRYPLIWGWASWRRVWTEYDASIPRWRQLRHGRWLERWIGPRVQQEFWRGEFDGVCAGEIDTWDHQLTFATWLQQSVSLHPAVNLISNIGFSEDATHTTWSTDAKANLPLQALPMPLRHPSEPAFDPLADARFGKAHHERPVPRAHHAWLGKLRRLAGRLRRSFQNAVPNPNDQSP